MYDTHKSYAENYIYGPFPDLLKSKILPKVHFKGPPQFEFLGIPLFIPFGVPAGPLLNSKFVSAALDAGFCVPTYKTVRSCSWESHKWPNIVKIHTQDDKQIFSSTPLPSVTGSLFKPKTYEDLSLSISNSFGVPSQIPDIWSQDFKQLNDREQYKGQHIVLSFQATAGDHHLLEDLENICHLAAQTISETKYCLLEINLSCPNESNEPIYKSQKDTLNVLKRAHSILQSYKNIKLIAKIGAMDFDSTHAFLSETGPYVNAISAINTVASNILDENNKVILGSGTQTGGVCGSAILSQGLLMCEYLAMSREKCGVKSNELGLVGVGGVSEATHFRNYIDAGADLVQAATGMMWNFELARQVAHSLGVHTS